MGKRINTARWMVNQKRWQINVQKDGVRRTFYASTPGRTGQRECNAKADAWLDDNIVDENTKIHKIFEAYIKSLELTASSSALAKVRSIGKNWLLPYLGNIRISNLTEQHIQDVINRAYKKGLAKKSLQNIRFVILAFVKYCRRCKYTTFFPEDVIIPKAARSKPKNILTLADLKKLFGIDTTIKRNKRMRDPYINAYRLQIATGLRPGELMALKWTDISGDIVQLSGSKNYLNEFTKGKNENAIRRFGLDEFMKTILENQAQYTADEKFVFGEMNLSSYEKAWKRYCRCNELQYVTLYELRHTFVSYVKSLPKGELQPVVGHSKAMDTYGRYGHETEGELEKTAAKIGNIFIEILNKQNC